MKISNIQALSFFFLFMFTISCGEIESTDEVLLEAGEELNEVIDFHSYANAQDVYTTHLHLDLNVDFEAKVLSGSATHDISNPSGTDKMILDIHQLEISHIELDDGEKTTFSVGNYDEMLGSAMTIDIKPGTKKIKVFYNTVPESQALQWLNPQQTAGKQHPYLFTQGQAILTRTWIPCQDTPGRRITYSADLQVPLELMAVMSADNPTEKSDDGKYHFEMKNPIPSYLIALAVGNLEFASLGPRTGVFTEPSMIDKSVYEFADVEKMMEAAEGLYGEYKWGRYDIIVLPPSFPFGGMENPKLTFATPTILAGDRSLVSLVAHELAHSWSGNLVTNATWDDFWLNEGFTVYLESRIMEEVYGKEYADMLLEIEYQGLEFENEDIMGGNHPEDTHLKLDLKGRNPDDGMTAIAYVKGAFFLKSLEEEVGREKFDKFLKQYFKDHEFETMTTEVFVSYLDENLLAPNELDFNVDAWIYGNGIPDNCIKVNCDKFEKVSEKCGLICEVTKAEELNIEEDEWTTHEWLHFIRHVPIEADAADLAMLDEKFDFSNCGNSEIMAEWFVVSIRLGYDGINPAMENFLVNVGRRKFLQPIYGELAKTEEGLDFAKEIYAKARPNYHSISYLTIDEILGWEG